MVCAFQLCVFVLALKDFFLRKADDHQRIYKDFKEFYDRLAILRREKSGGIEDILFAMATGYDYRRNTQKSQTVEMISPALKSYPNHCPTLLKVFLFSTRYPGE